MHIFRYTSPNTGPMEQGVLINSPESITWTEKYDGTSSFVITADPSSEVKKELPIGSFISHTNTRQVMVVEDHSITDEGNTGQKLTVTGRSFSQSVMGKRVFGYNIANDLYPEDSEEYEYPEWPTNIQIKSMIERNMIFGYVAYADNTLPYVQVESPNIPGATVEKRRVGVGPLFDKVSEILKVDHLGIRDLRPSSSNNQLRIYIYKGEDVSDKVSFSLDSNEIESAEYLWSNQKYRNCAFIKSKYFQRTLILTSAVGFGRTWVHVDASDIDEKYETIPVDVGVRGIIYAMMDARGREVLAKQRDIAIRKVQPKKNILTDTYRVNYQLGDIVGIRGGYGLNGKMRVTEHVEILDENGFVAYPTLEVIEEDE